MAATLPADLPEYVGKAIDELDVRSDRHLRKNENANFAAGYYAAVADLKEMLETEAKLLDAERKSRLRSLTHAADNAA